MERLHESRLEREIRERERERGGGKPETNRGGTKRELMQDKIRGLEGGH